MDFSKACSKNIEKPLATFQ